MKKQTKVLATSIATIAMCASLAVGGTFALFTSEDEVNIAVTAGTVKIEATAKNLDKSDLYSGQAAINGGTVSIENMLPGDSITFNVDVMNYSTVPANYRTVLTSEDGGLADALTISFEKATTQAPISFLGGYGVDNWKLLEAAEEGGEVVETITVTIAFNSQGDEIDNLYQGKNCAYKVYVEAVQGNAEVIDPIKKDLDETDVHSDTYYIYSEEGMRLMTGIADSQLASMPNEVYLNFKLMNNLDMTGVPYYPTTRWFINFDGNGKTIKNLTAVHNPNDIVKKAGLFGYSANVKNVTLKNMNVAGNQAGLLVGSTDGSTFSNITIEGNNNVTWVDSGLGWMDGGIGALVGVAYRTNFTDITVANGAKITLNYNGLANQLDFANDELGGHFYVLGVPTVLTNISVAANAIVKNGDWTYLATNAASLRNGVSKGYNVKMTTDIELDADLNAPYGNNYGIAQNGGVLDGDNHSLTIEGTLDDSGKSDDYAIMTSGGTIKNLKLGNCFRAVMVMYPQSDIELDNVTIVDSEVCYTINTGESGADNIKLIAKNCTIGGWTSIGDAVSSVEFVECDFVQGKYLTTDSGRLVKPYVNMSFDKCTFVKDMYLDCSAFAGNDGIRFTDCKMSDGTEITAQNLMLLFNSGVYGNGAYNDWKYGGDATADFVPVYVDGVRCAAMEYIADGLYKQEDGSYIVVNANGFKYLSDKSLTANNNVAEAAVVNIGADIDLKNAEVRAIIAQRGDSLTINGNGYTISNAKVVSGANANPTGQASLFYCYPDSTLTVSNLAVSGATVQANINGSGYAGVIVGYNEGATTLTDVDVKNSTVNGEKSCAILVGFVPVYGTLTMNGCDVGVDCAVNATEDRAAAYAGRVYGATTITTCSVADDFVATATDGWASKYIGQRYVGCTTCTIDGVEYVDANSVQDLIERATEGTTLVLNECGMEYPTLVIRNADGSPKRNFAVQTNPGEKANVMNLTLKANGNVVLGFVDLNGSTNIVLDGFTFDAAKAQVVKSCSRGSFVDTEYSANIAFAQGQTISARYVTIKNCTFEGNSTATQYAPICVQDAGRATGPAGDITVDKCTFNCDVFRYLSLDYVAYGTVIITNNTFGGANYANTTGHNAINGTSCGANFVITGNTFNGWKDGEAAIGISKSTVAEERTIVVKNNKFYFQAADANFTADIVYLKSSATAKTFDTFHKLTEMSGNEYFDALAGRADENVTAADYYTTVATTVNAAQAAGEKYCVITNVLKYKVK